jgi:hypothetical protein
LDFIQLTLPETRLHSFSIVRQQNFSAMSDLTREIIKIAVDKGLLGGVAALLAYYGSRLLERYKAQNLYQQQLSARRLQAYEDIGEYVYGSFKQLKTIFATIAKARGGGNVINQATVDEINQSWDDLRKLLNAGEFRVARNMLFLSRDCGVMLTDFYANTSVFLDTLLKPGDTIQKPFDQLEAAMKEIETVHARLHNQLANELNEGPFRQ